jgi:hypothetical protein
MPRLADTIDASERFFYLDEVCWMARARGVKASEVAMVLGPEQRALWNSINAAAAAGLIDWDSVLRLGNARYDRIAEAMRKPARAQRKAADDALDLEDRKNADQAHDMWKLGTRILSSPRKTFSESIGHTLCGLFTPALRATANAEDRCFVQADLTKLALALAAYHADQGAYPAKLADLPPKYIAHIPKDRYSDGDLHYSRQAGGYLLYSVGMNGQDDGGRGMEDRNEGSEPWDDIAVRVGKR